MPDPLSKGERTSQAIVDAAYHLFVEQGFHGTSMRQIARRAGITVGGIYNHFEGKEQIFEQVLLQKHPYRRVLAILEATPAANVEEFARSAANAITAELGSRPEFLNLAFIELSEFRGKHVSQVFQAIFPLSCRWQAACKACPAPYVTCRPRPWSCRLPASSSPTTWRVTVPPERCTCPTRSPSSSACPSSCMAF